VGGLIALLRLFSQKTRNTFEESVISVATSCNRHRVPSALGQPGLFGTSNDLISLTEVRLMFLISACQSHNPSALPKVSLGTSFLAPTLSAVAVDGEP